MSREWGRMSVFVAAALCAVMWPGVGALAASAGQALEMTNLEMRTPTVAIPYYHFSARLHLPKPSSIFVRKLEVNGEVARNYFLLRKDDKIEPDLPRSDRRMAIAEAQDLPTPERVYDTPTLIGRADWRAGQECTISVSLSLDSKTSELVTASAKATAPAAGGYWNPDWKEYQTVVVSETEGLDRVAEPVEVTMLFYDDTLVDPSREFRVVEYDWRHKTHREVPSQVVDVATVHATEPKAYDEHGQRKPATYVSSKSVTLVFQADVPGRTSKLFFVFYGNPKAPAPNYATALKVTGKAPGVTVENQSYRLKLHDASGMLDEVTLKSKPQYTFVHKQETNGAIQWNPGAYAPPRPWVHVSDWEPDRYDYQYEDVRGPLVFRTRRWGNMPEMPELITSMEYTFYAGLPYFQMRSVMYARDDIHVQALRNAEVVFSRDAFDEAAWWDPFRRRVETRPLSPKTTPDLSEWLMPQDTPWIAFLDRTKGCGFAGIQTQYANGSAMGGLRTLNPYMYITVGPWVYWTRALSYPFGSHNPQHLIKVNKGSVFMEEWAYLPFDVPTRKGATFREIEKWQKLLSHPLEVRLEDPISPRMEVPEHIYTDETKKG